MIARQDQPIAARIEGEGRPLVLLHGLGAESGQMADALPVSEGCCRICPDMPGHGRTPPGAYGFHAFAERTIALLDDLQIGRAVFGGISMGAGIALRIALDAPERVAGLLLIRPAWIDRPALPHLGLVARVGAWQSRTPAQAPDLLEADPEFRAIAAANPAAAQSLRGLLTRPQAMEAAAVLSALVEDRPFESLDDLARIARPAAVFANADDPLHPPAIAEAIAARLPFARLVRIPSRYMEPAAHLAALRSEATQFLIRLGEF
jgi:pimeloyl-ACP methyl ester carboxylesterase